MPAMGNRPILYSFRRCPYAMRARLALAISETPYELREVHWARKPAAMLAVSSKGTVPVLVLSDGTVLDESLQIMSWALDRYDPETWLARNDPALIDFSDGRFKPALDRYKYADRYSCNPAEQREKGLEFLRILEGRLAVAEHLSGPRHGFADAAVLPFVRQFAAVDPDWIAAQGVPRVRAWLAAYTASPLFERIMLRVAPWSPPVSDARAGSRDEPSPDKMEVVP